MKSDKSYENFVFPKMDELAATCGRCRSFGRAGLCDGSGVVGLLATGD